MSEFGFIHDLRALADPDHALDFTDDAATLPAADVICTDTLVEGLHFIGRESPADLAHKMLAVNVSDVLAMNARPSHALLNLCLPERCDAPWRAGFVAGMGEACAHFGVTLLGGDTTGSTGPLVLTATVLGQLEGRSLWTRSAAQPGERICVAAPVGQGALGLADALAGRDDTTNAHHYRRPMPRTDLLGRPGVGGCADISDGLIADLSHICRSSEVQGVVDLASIPLANTAGDWTEQLCGGDEYQLIFTLAPNAPLPPACTVIGEIVARPEPKAAPVRLLGPEAIVTAALSRSGYQHF